MNEPGRLLDGDFDEFERALLDSARADRGSERARVRALAAWGALGIELAASTAAASSKAFATAAASGFGGAPALGTPSLTFGALAKWLGAGIVAGGISAGGAFVLREPSSEAPSPPEPASLASPAPHATVSPPVVRERAPESTPSASSTSATKPTESAPANDEPSVTSAPAGLTSSGAFPLDTSSVQLGEEVAHLERARRSLRSGDARSALVELERYEARFPHGLLAKEATLIAVEARLRAGDKAGARALAARALSVDSTSPHAARLRALLAAEAP